jgi:Co/Zn/Cd efflux system component
MFLFAIAVFARATYQLFMGASPEASTMGIVGVVALLANLLCLLLLTRHRNDNLNKVVNCSEGDNRVTTCSGAGREPGDPVEN